MRRFKTGTLCLIGILVLLSAACARVRPPRGSVFVQVVRSSPAGGDSAMYTTLLLALASARRSIRITNPYFMLDEAMTETLLKRIQAGVSVEVLAPPPAR